MIKKNVVFRVKNPCKNGVKIEMDLIDFVANFVVPLAQENVQI